MGSLSCVQSAVSISPTHTAFRVGVFCRLSSHTPREVSVLIESVFARMLGEKGDVATAVPSPTCKHHVRMSSMSEKLLENKIDILSTCVKFRSASYGVIVTFLV